jgi:gamma-glutamylcysteine synthetase
MANKFTDALAALSLKTKNVENQISAARSEAKEKLDARIAESKATLAAKKENFLSKAERIKATVAEKKQEKNYQEACAYADDCVDLAIIALGEVETATLEAFAQKLKLEESK